MLINTQTSYSLLESTLTIENYVRQGQAYGYQSLAIADINVLHGAYEFYQACQEADIHPVIGMTARFAGLLESDQLYDMLVYAKDFKGMQALMTLSYTLSKKDVSPHDLYAKLGEYKDQLWLVLPLYQSELSHYILQDQFGQAQAYMEAASQYLPIEYLDLGISLQPANQLAVQSWQDFAKGYGLDLVISQKHQLLKAEDQFSLQVLQAIKDNRSDLELNQVQTRGILYLRPQDEYIQAYQEAGLQEALDRTQNQAQVCQIDFPEETLYLPRFPLEKDQSSSDFLKNIAWQSLKEKALDNQSEYCQRLDHELTTIISMGFADYFLIVWDILAYCGQAGIRRGPGRGSAAGSLVAYLLDITQVDPIHYGLVFERFLNPERYTLPDIDIDIPDTQRHKVFNYVAQRYGRDRVAHIITFGSFGAKQAVRDVLRVLGRESQELKAWSRAIPTDANQPMTLSRAYEESLSLRNLVDAHPDNQRIFQTARRIEGLYRHSSTHAAAIVINEFPLLDIIPLIYQEGDIPMTQYSMYPVEAIGLLKMDFLGLRNLTLLDDIIRLVHHRQGLLLDVQAFPLDDPDTLALFQAGRTNGVFQFESQGIKRVLKELHPESFEDIVAVNALYRPGPMKQIDRFIRRKRGQEQVSYPLPVMEEILQQTYGVIVYQEQVMKILVEVGQFSLGHADMIRRAMSKKQADVMEEARSAFIQGARNQGYPQELAEGVYDYIYEFSNYGFNRAHAVVYSTLAYQLAYLKAHYPLEFYQVLLNSGSSLNRTQKAFINETIQVFGQILPLDINASQLGFDIQEESIRLGLTSVQGLRQDFCRNIVDNRSVQGPFTSFLDFLRRIQNKYLSRDNLLPLIYLGAFDGLGYNRRTLVENLDKILQSIVFTGNNISLFQAVEPKITPYPEYDYSKLLEIQEEYLGFYPQGHPISHYHYLLDQVQGLMTLEDLDEKSLGFRGQVLAYIYSIRTITTKKGDPMAFLRLRDENGEMEAVVFPQTYRAYRHLLLDQAILVVQGRLDQNKRGDRQWIVEGLTQPADLDSSESFETCYIQLSPETDLQESVNFVKDLIQDHPGPVSIIFVTPDRKAYSFQKSEKLAYSQRVQDRLRTHFGFQNVVFR